MSCDPRATTPAVLDRIALDLPDQDALVTEDMRFTYAQLRDEVRRAAAALSALGVAPGDRVALCRRGAGAAEHPLYRLGGPGILARSKATVLVGMGRFLKADRMAELDRAELPDLQHVVRIPVQEDDTQAATSWDEFIAAGASVTEAEVDAHVAAVRSDDLSDILFTSGTTGSSKGVLCAHRQSLAGPATWAACGQMTAEDRSLCINPFFHNFGYKARDPGLPADRGHPDPAAHLRSGRCAARHRRTPDHRAARAADDLPDLARSPRA